MADDESSATDVFEVVSNDTRLDVLHALADAASESPEDPWVAYSDLRAAAGVLDKGNFNYHLDRLGEFVETRSGTYRITHVGMEFVAAVARGTFDTDWTWGPVDVPGECPFCGDPVRLRYEDMALDLTCGVDDHAMTLGVAPSLLETTPEDEVVERVAHVVYRGVDLLRGGICVECQGRMDGRIHDEDVSPTHYHYHGECRRCGFNYGVPVGTYALTHPDVEQFLYGHGVDARTTPFWTLPFCAPGAETVLGTDPLRLRVDATLDGETLSLTLDREGSVVETTRSRE